MKSFWLFRTNLRQLEYYHDYIDLEEFKRKCHDFYLLQGIWFLENNIFDEVIIWRLTPKHTNFQKEIIFYINGNRFVQRFVNSFDDCFSYQPTPTVTFFRGGFPEYGKLTRMRPGFFGLSLYCGTGKRVRPQHAGSYNKILVEDDRDYGNHTITFYKTANQEIFKPLIIGQRYDICWPCNFSQRSYKGQEFFIKEVSKSAYLKGLKILHIGNKPEIGKGLAKTHGLTNITFMGHLTRPDLNALLNQCKVALVTSNQNDGSPRIITEIMCAGIPLLLRMDTRALFYYRKDVVNFNDSDIESKIKSALQNHARLKKIALSETPRLSMDVICKRNLALWGQL